MQTLTPKKTLVVVGHPDLERSRVHRAWTLALREAGHATVHVLAERYSHGAPVDVAYEQALMRAHDRIILQFPFYWYSSPPRMKEWFDKVLQRGWAYGPGGRALSGKQLGVAVSTGSSAEDYRHEGRYGRTMEDLTAPYEVLAIHVGMDYLPGFFLNDVRKVTDEQLEVQCAAYCEHVVAAHAPHRKRA